MKQKRAVRWTLPFLLLLTMANDGVLRAQSGISPSLAGVLKDSTGAVLPGAVVTLTFLSSGAHQKLPRGPKAPFSFCN